MKWSPFLIVLALIGLVAADGAWKVNQIYKYNLRAFAKTHNHDELYSRARLSIYPQSADLLFGEISEAEHAQVDNFNDKSTNVEWPLSKLFKIHLKDGVIHSLSVVSTMDNRQINQLKAIVSQFLVDTNVPNDVQSDDGSYNGIYSKMEATTTGRCETTYEIKAGTSRELVDIVKSTNLKNCEEHSDHFHSHKNGSAESPLVTRVTISGNVRSYTIQSAVTTNEAADFHEHVNITLESVQQSAIPSHFESANFTNVGNLLYTKNEQENEVMGLAMPKCPKASDAEVKTSSCWSLLPSAKSICKGDFGPEWDDTGDRCCGFLCLGKEADCRRSYPGCDATACYSALVSRDTLCKDQFKDDLPVTCGGFEDCSPGFYRSRCCPESYK